MESTVQLQDLFSYAFWPIVLCIVLLVLTIAAGVLISIIKKNAGRAKAPAAPAPKVFTPLDRDQIKGKYMGILNNLQRRLSKGEISEKECFQELSICIREFVFEITGVNVTTCTLTDIKRLNMPYLEDLINQYYRPEFSEDESPEGAEDGIKNAMRVVDIWN